MFIVQRSSRVLTHFAQPGGGVPAPAFPVTGAFSDAFVYGGPAGDTLPVYAPATYDAPPFAFGNCVIAASLTAFRGPDAVLGLNDVLNLTIYANLDLVVQVDALPTVNGTVIGAVYCYSEGGAGINGYRLAIVRSGGVNFGTIRRYDNGATTDILAENWSEFSGAFVMGVRKQGPVHTLYTSLDGVTYTKRSSVTDSTYASGGLAMIGASSAGLPTCGAVAAGQW